MVEKKKTSININPELWTKWLHFVIDETGSTKKASEEFEKALLFYMKHKQGNH